jgi:hypothetical protein
MPTGLDHPDALDPGRVGAKACRLAAARRAGLSVLDGVVIEVAHSLPFLAAAARVAVESGPAASRLAMMEFDLPSGLVDAVKEAVGFERLVVRSSSPLEDAGEWSGAFASYVDVGADDLETAVRGCWASMLGRDALERFERAGGDPAATGMAVLVQPAITPSPGGVAETDDSVVRITVADNGELAGLLQGWARGRRAELPRSGAATGPAVQAHGTALLEQVAELARACRERLGDDHVEWAFAGGCCYLLQARRAKVRSYRPRARRRASASALATEHAADIARAAARFGGASGDELLLPWCFAPGGVRSLRTAPRGATAPVAGATGPAAGATEPVRGATAVTGNVISASLRSAARALTAQAWGTDEDEAVELARSAVTRLRDRLDPEAISEFLALAPVDAHQGRLILAAVQRAAATAVAAGQLFDPEDAWRLPPALFDQLLDQAVVRSRPIPAAGRWESFLGEAVLANGRQACSGEPASAGLGAGRLLMLGAPQRLAGTRERWILHVTNPLPAYAPLLWGAAGLISTTGSASAHLFDVARTLGVPGVAGVELPSELGHEPVVAVNGLSGEIVILV